MKKIHKRTLCGLVSGILVLGTAGCSGESKTVETKSQVQSQTAQNEESQALTQAVQEGGKDITVWIPSNLVETERDYYYKMLGEIDEAHEEFQIKISEQADLSNQLLSAIISDDLPDLTMSDGNRLGVFCHAGVFLPLDDYFSAEK